MGLKNFQIVFDNPWNTYYCGQPVSGKVLLTTESAKKIRGIIILLKGEAEVRFEETTTTTDSEGKTLPSTTQFTSSETYFETKYNLLGGPSSESTLPAGEHCYMFNSILPPNLPSSFEGEFGHVRYTVKVTIDRPWKFDHDTKTAFTVINPMDLNLHPTAKLPVQLTVEKHFGCWCCKSAPLSITASMPVSGYVSGQQIPVTIEVDNKSDQLISAITCELNKTVAFHAKYPNSRSKDSKVTVGNVELEGSVSANGSNCWTRQLAIPPLPPSNLTNCSIIDLNYELVIVAKVASCLHRNLDLKIPIILGTIPVAFAPPPAMGMAPIGQDLLPLKDGPLPDQPIGWQQSGALYPNLPPPSFEQGASGALNIRDASDGEHVQGDTSFTPRYPFYNMEPSAPPPQLL